MTSGTPYEQGDVLLVPFPFSDLTSVKQRPVLVLSKRTHVGDDIITCGITSNLEDRDHSVRIDTSDLADGVLPKVSRIKVDKLFTLDKRIVRKKLARVKVAVIQDVRRELLSLI